MGNVLCAGNLFCDPRKDTNDDDIDDDFRTVRSRTSSWGDDVWHDALMEHDFLDNELFDVTDDELLKIKSHLERNFVASEASYFSDAYILSVASKPYSKDRTRRRPLEYSMEKLTNVLTWRKEHSADQLEYWMDLMSGRASTDNVDPDIIKRAQQLVKIMNTASTYWHGHTKDGRPILWIRTHRKGWYPDAEAEANALILSMDAAIRYGMPTNVTDVCIISHSHRPPPPSPSCVIKILQGLVNGYPDRMHVLISAPVSKIVEFVMSLLLPLMPGRLAEKFVFLNSEDLNERLEEMLLNGREDIPTFFGGPVDHDQWYPEEKEAPSMGGSLKFDFYGMVTRLQEQRDNFENRKHVTFAQGY